MKLLLNAIFIYLIVSIRSFGLANAQTINIYDEYKAGRRIIKEIITDNNLEKTLTGYTYGGYFIGQSLFLIIKEGDSFFEVYQGEKDKGILNTYKFDLEDKRLSSLFAWTKQDKVTYNIQSAEYFAIYYYFVLYDKSHNEKIAFFLYTYPLLNLANTIFLNI
ncbi:hypothetical protein [Bacteroides sp.]|uniref:hypothetical protein n=1 Tax=Bacteroides sp. TaxID=29523 RepID=UPI0025C047E9|nr:hypothetical protein [Bacteroides sp.]